MAEAPGKPEDLEDIAAQAAGKARPYDLGSPECGARGPMPALDRINARFSAGPRYVFPPAATPVPGSSPR